MKDDDGEGTLQLSGGPTGSFHQVAITMVLDQVGDNLTIRLGTETGAPELVDHAEAGESYQYHRCELWRDPRSSPNVDGHCQRKTPPTVAPPGMTYA